MNFLKHTLLKLAIAFFTFSGFAQNDFSAKTKGTYFINGNINVFNTMRKIEIGNNSDDSDAFTINFAPKGAYFIKDNLALGLELTISSNKETNEDAFGDFESTTTGFGIGPFARYYFKNGFFGEALIGIGSQKTKVEGGVFGDNELKSTTFGFRLGVGYAFFLGNHVAIEPTVNYSLEDINPEDAPSDYKETLSSIFLGIGISAYF